MVFDRTRLNASQNPEAEARGGKTEAAKGGRGGMWLCLL